MQTTLFALFNAADAIILGGYEVETINYADGGCRVEYCGGDEKAFFLDQPVALVDGECTAMTAKDPQFDSAALQEFDLTFQVTRLLQPADLA